MPEKMYENEVKMDEVLPEAQPKQAAYSEFSIAYDAQGRPLPTSAVSTPYITAAAIVQVGWVQAPTADFSIPGTWGDVTDATITLTTGAQRVILHYVWRMTVASTGGSCDVRFVVDSTNEPVTNIAHNVTERNGASTFVSGVLTAGSHTFKVQMQSNGTTPVVSGSASLRGYFLALETNLTT